MHKKYDANNRAVIMREVEQCLNAGIMVLMEQSLLHWQHGKAFRHLIYYDFFYTGAFTCGLIKLVDFHIFRKKGK